MPLVTGQNDRLKGGGGGTATRVHWRSRKNVKRGLVKGAFVLRIESCDWLVCHSAGPGVAEIR